MTHRIDVILPSFPVTLIVATLDDNELNYDGFDLMDLRLATM